MTSTTQTPGPRDLIPPAVLTQAFDVEVYDRDGKASKLGKLVEGRRTALVFVRHFWCVNCQAYVRYLSAAVPPGGLGEGMQILIIGCGTHTPIPNYIAASSSAYPIYTDPSTRLHALFGFKWTLAQDAPGDAKKDYMRDAGGVMYRIWGGLKYALGSIGHVNAVGPKSLNGGEVVLSADGKCEFVHRMQNTVDHADVRELAGVLGAKFDESVVEGGNACGEVCEGGKGETK
ncbi:hypothetical protein FB567DRAFT_128649 [Paraphoma chrysanthemicola]|uniref:Uncharacterized protein n=1 Tax=Paraphoma chrysanthemicola TaxID=798071 RepID=A0A8K0R024_9PLEO|nr:hypothetical protein FB567DRAFT_128649 [Paraphoma chrysanthemicola]